MSLFVDGERAEETEADGSGAFVAFLSLGRSDAPRVISFETGGRPAEATLVVAPNPAEGSPDAPTDPVAASAGTSTDTPADPGTDPAATADATSDQDAPGTPDATTVALLDEAPEAPSFPDEDAAGPDDAAEPAPETPAVAPAADDTPPAVLLARRDGLRILQAGEAPGPVDVVAIDAIGYDAGGDVMLAGRGSAGAGVVRVYLDNRPLTEVPVGPDGAWETTLPDIDTGTYTLRVDEIAADGSVASRAETPFRRESADAIAAAGGRTGIVTVQPGNTLWGISDAAYGEGIMFVSLFAANADRIRDPDLIYPGQIFDVPEPGAAEADFDANYRRVYRN